MAAETRTSRFDTNDEKRLLFVKSTRAFIKEFLDKDSRYGKKTDDSLIPLFEEYTDFCESKLTAFPSYVSKFSFKIIFNFFRTLRTEGILKTDPTFCVISRYFIETGNRILLEIEKEESREKMPDVGPMDQFVVSQPKPKTTLVWSDGSHTPVQPAEKRQRRIPSPPPRVRCVSNYSPSAPEVKDIESLSDEEDDLILDEVNVRDEVEKEVEEEIGAQINDQVPSENVTPLYSRKVTNKTETFTASELLERLQKSVDDWMKEWGENKKGVTAVFAAVAKRRRDESPHPIILDDDDDDDEDDDDDDDDDDGNSQRTLPPRDKDDSDDKRQWQ